jgi:hypothetical protein
MPKDAFTLSDVREPTMTIVCEPCGRRGRYNVKRLMAKHGDAKILFLLSDLTNCPKAGRSTSMIVATRAAKGFPLASFAYLRRDAPDVREPGLFAGVASTSNSLIERGPRQDCRQGEEVYGVSVIRLGEL